MRIIRRTDMLEEKKEGLGPKEKPTDQGVVGHVLRLAAEIRHALIRRMSGVGKMPEVRSRVEARSEEVKPSDIVDIVHQLGLEAQYADRLDTLKHFGFLDKNGKVRKGDAPAPPFEKGIGAFKPEELKIAENYQNPVLILAPENGFGSKVIAIDSHRMPRQAKTYVNEVYRDPPGASGKITGYRVYIVDGAPEMKPYRGDLPELTIINRIKKRRADRKPGEKGMNRHIYALLMMEAIKKGKPIDRSYDTVLDDDPALPDLSLRVHDSDGIPIAGWSSLNFLRVYFQFCQVVYAGRDTRFRSVVGGDELFNSCARRDLSSAA